MTAQEMIDRYQISLVRELTRSGYALTGKIRMGNYDAKDHLEEIKASKPEILEILTAKYEAEEAARKERKAKIDVIEGLKEIKDCQNAWNNWHYEFNRRMEDESLSSFIPEAPKVKPEELKKKYPRAAAYLKAERDADSANYEISAIGRKGLERIINNEDYNVVLADMQKEHDEFAARHIWD